MTHSAGRIVTESDSGRFERAVYSLRQEISQTEGGRNPERVPRHKTRLNPHITKESPITVFRYILNYKFKGFSTYTYSNFNTSILQFNFTTTRVITLTKIYLKFIYI